MQRRCLKNSKGQLFTVMGQGPTIRNEPQDSMKYCVIKNGKWFLQSCARVIDKTSPSDSQSAWQLVLQMNVCEARSSGEKQVRPTILYYYIAVKF